MKQPSIWKQIFDENESFIGQFISEGTFEKAGLTQQDNQTVCQKRDAKVLRGVTKTAPGPWQVRFTINGKQEILFVCRCLTVAALMRDLLLTMLMRYSHCAKVPSIDPKSEHAGFNLPLAVRDKYRASVLGEETIFGVLNFVERVEKILLDRGIVHSLTSEEIAAREQLASQAKTHADSAAQLRYSKRRATHLEQILERVQELGKTCPQLVQVCARLSDFIDRAEKTEAKWDVLSQQLEFAVGQFESLKNAVSDMTATFRKLLDEARGR